MAIRKALQSVSRWLVARKGPREQASSGAGGSATEDSPLETVRKILIIYGVMRIYGPNGLCDKMLKEAREAEEAKKAKDLPK